MARLWGRGTRDGTVVHPADLDDALCLGALVASSADGGTRVPFAVDDALLQAALGELWALLNFLSPKKFADLDGFLEAAAISRL